MAPDLCVSQAFGLLGNVMSMVGGICSICCSLLLPSAFYLALFWRELKPPTRTGVASVLVLGVVMLGLITMQNVVEIWHQVHAAPGMAESDPAGCSL